VELIEGRQPVREALRAGRKVHRVLVAEGAREKGSLEDIVELARAAGVAVERVTRASLDHLAMSHAHQGVIAEADPLRSRSWREGMDKARKAGQVPLLLALDGVEDPQNLGALLRSAEVLGAHAALVPKRRSAPLGAVAGKASAGAMEHLVIDQVNSLDRALADCREAGLWIVALAGGGDDDIRTCALLDEPVVIVVGAEGRGVSRLVGERADARVSIPMSGRIDSLNASVAGAIALWEAARRRT
jgi:23S rRNA (guanosine2251-2'-O)-methyltransferase